MQEDSALIQGGYRLQRRFDVDSHVEGERASIADGLRREPRHDTAGHPRPYERTPLSRRDVDVDVRSRKQPRRSLHQQAEGRGIDDRQFPA